MSLPGPAAGPAGAVAVAGAEDLAVAVIGARRVRFGTGPFLAEQAARAGARVTAVYGTSGESAAEAAEALAARGVHARPYDDPVAMLRGGRPEVLIVASPAGTHRTWLRAALDAGAHVYCEKPLLDREGGVEEARLLARAFAARGTVLAENCQWPQALAAFERLHPGIDPARAGSLEMRLAPPLRGRERWAETLPHPLSLLQAVAPGPGALQDVAYEEEDPGVPCTRLRFIWRCLDREVRVTVTLEDAGTWPRPAEFALDGAACRRRIRTPDYVIDFTAGDPADPGAPGVEVGDPMENALRAFLKRAVLARNCGSAPLDEDLVRRQLWLERLLDAYPHA